MLSYDSFKPTLDAVQNGVNPNSATESSDDAPEDKGSPSTLISGEETKYSLEIGDHIYYYSSFIDRARAKFADAPSANAVGTAVVNKEWGERTEYYLVSGDSKWYFNSRIDLARAKFLDSESMQKLAVGRYPSHYVGGEDVKNDADAVVMEKGQKSNFYMDIKNTRYYYNSIWELMNAALSTEPWLTSCGTATTMSEWGKVTDFYIDKDGYRLYFSSEEDREAAQKELDEHGGVLTNLDINKLLVGKRQSSTVVRDNN